MQKTIHLSKCILGTAGLGGVWGKVDEKESVKTILMALENGITQMDTAPAYGNAEELLGYALQQWKGVKPTISTKVGRLKTHSADHGLYDYSAEGMVKSVEQSLKVLSVEVIDLLFLHEPAAILNREEAPEIVEQMLEFRQKGYARKIGIGGNLPEWFFPYAIGATFDVIMEYNRLDACCQDALKDSLPHSTRQGMEFYVASPLHMGLLGNRFESFISSPPDWLEKPAIEKAKLLKKIADQNQMELHSLAIRFLYTIKEDIKIVIGPSDTSQLNHLIDDIGLGALPEQMVEDIINL